MSPLPGKVVRGRNTLKAIILLFTISIQFVLSEMNTRGTTDGEKAILQQWGAIRYGTNLKNTFSYSNKNRFQPYIKIFCNFFYVVIKGSLKCVVPIFKFFVGKKWMELKKR